MMNVNLGMSKFNGLNGVLTRNEQQNLSLSDFIQEEKGNGKGDQIVVREMWFELDLSGMGIRVLSKEIRYYPHLTALYLNHNKILDLSDDVFSELKSLVVLDLSNNLLVKLPNSISQLQSLERLSLHQNRISDLPAELGNLFKLKDLQIDGNPLSTIPNTVIQGGTDMIISYLRDRIPTGPPPPERRFISYLESHITIADKDRIRVLTYNVLAESYATPQRCFYCPPWALEWNYRKIGILKEILTYDCDVICLQEVEACQFTEFFQPELANHGYVGVIALKSRAKIMDDCSNVDGCAIFYKQSRFNLVEEKTFEYQSIAMQRHREFSEDPEGFSRLMTKDNVGITAILQMKEDVNTIPPSPTKRGWNPVNKKHILIANTHIHWNPDNKDVKLIQVQLLLEGLQSLVGSPKSKWHNIPMIIAGDFNSTIDSGPYELLTLGQLPPHHRDLEPYSYGSYTSQGLRHSLRISSSYAQIGEPPFTNYTNDYAGVLDYIWYTHETLAVSKVLEPVHEETVRQTRLPNAYMHSDHIHLLAEFFLRP